MVQGKIIEPETPTIQLGPTPSGLISDSPPSSPIFTLDALLAATLPIYHGLAQAPNMLACIPSGSHRWEKFTGGRTLNETRQRHSWLNSRPEFKL